MLPLQPHRLPSLLLFIPLLLLLFPSNTTAYVALPSSPFHLIIHQLPPLSGREAIGTGDESDYDIRPASLADCRRHILGVHARIPQDLLTICCQASRISKESNYKLYADKALLALADHHKMRTMRQPLTTAASNNSAPTMVPLNDASKLLEDKKLMDSCSADSSIVLAPMINNFSRGRPAHVGRYGEDVPEVPDDRHSGLRLPGTSLLSLDEGNVLVKQYKLPHTWRLERVINLPYSDRAFRELVSQQMKLEPEFVDSLINRMEVYSQHSVYIIRQNTTRQSNQRFYACSACLNTSPHGLGDMRKHILGVHAHVPERFKSAAMNAGRLNRDDYQLYSYEQLIALSQSPMRGGNMRGPVSDPLNPKLSFPSMKRGPSSASLLNGAEKKPRIQAGSVSLPSDVIPDEADDLKPLPSLPSSEHGEESASSVTSLNQASNNRVGASHNMSIWPGQEDEDAFAQLSDKPAVYDENDGGHPSPQYQIDQQPASSPQDSRPS
ncbi:hypothetical protein Ciccas_006139 [Cichlidogyrus casuarinus]|uniref:C2H2-type domain-containing protein n=1 Tax=Cichlidogyrus casuarinus TaxID=1844966 RepID=A0ABD2Q6M8_9PLAT